jgi:hypothetical protein
VQRVPLDGALMDLTPIVQTITAAVLAVATIAVAATSIRLARHNRDPSSRSHEISRKVVRSTASSTSRRSLGIRGLESRDSYSVK